MSKMSDLFIEIQELLEEGKHPSYISMMLDVPVQTVYDVLDQLQAIDDQRDTDFPSEAELDAMADYYAAKEEYCEFD